MDVEALVRPVVEASQMELVEVAFRRQHGARVLRVTVDADEAPNLDALGALSERVARRLDLEGFDPGSYSLEVSSPGIEHPLRTPGQFRRAIGSRVAVMTREPADNVDGTLTSVETDALVVSTAEGDRRIQRADVSWVRTVVDWDAELKGAGR